MADGGPPVCPRGLVPRLLEIATSAVARSGRPGLFSVLARACGHAYRMVVRRRCFTCGSWSALFWSPCARPLAPRRRRHHGKASGSERACMDRRAFGPVRGCGSRLAAASVSMSIYMSSSPCGPTNSFESGGALGLPVCPGLHGNRDPVCCGLVYVCACAWSCACMQWFPCGRWSALLLGQSARPLGSAGVCDGRVASACAPWPAWGPGPGLRCVGAGVPALSCVCAPGGSRAHGGLGLGVGFPCFSFLFFSVL
mgnify:CR=1 FL=1